MRGILMSCGVGVTMPSLTETITITNWKLLIFLTLQHLNPFYKVAPRQLGMDDYMDRYRT